MILEWRLGTARYFYLATLQNLFFHFHCHRYKSKCIHINHRYTNDIFTRGHHNGQNIVCHLFIYFFHKPLRGLVPRVENDTVVAGVDDMIISHSTVLNQHPWLLVCILYWCCWQCIYIGNVKIAFLLELPKNRLARGMNLEFSISQSRSDRTKLCGTFSKKKPIAILFQKLFSSPILVEWVSMTTTTCVYFVSYNLNNLSFTFQNHCIVFLAIID